MAADSIDYGALAKAVADAVSDRLTGILGEIAECCRLDAPGKVEYCGCWDVPPDLARWAEKTEFDPQCEKWLESVGNRLGIPRRDLLAGVIRQWLAAGLEEEMKTMSKSVPPEIP